MNHPPAPSITVVVLDHVTANMMPWHPQTPSKLSQMISGTWTLISWENGRASVDLSVLMSSHGFQSLCTTVLLPAGGHFTHTGSGYWVDDPLWFCPPLPKLRPVFSFTLFRLCQDSCMYLCAILKELLDLRTLFGCTHGQRKTEDTATVITFVQ